MALVLALVWLEKVTVPGPLTCDHNAVKVDPVGSPSSLMAPVRFTVLAGNVMTVLSTVTLIAGPWFGRGSGSTVTVTCELVVNSESVAVNCSV